ncbi:hypothetical protein [Romboutsia lituseburensis]|uniref:hypothetical protein n=1 Tax=Romboutsia lituseburensis TaxID=1537 RepID=UPI00215A8B90|nr:hypothetical protein [Romboutsia lituseburensis]MCR8743990.1 hypothetical protein [Romboutsia lituseburensis]
MGKYTLDYFSKYYFYEEDEFLEKIEDAKLILEKLKESNRFDYNGHSFKYTKFNNISMSETERNVELYIHQNDINIIMDGELKHLDLIYKFDTKHLEDHVRVATRISEKTDDISCLLYIDYNQAEAFLADLENVKKEQVNNMNK